MKEMTLILMVIFCLYVQPTIMGWSDSEDSESYSDSDDSKNSESYSASSDERYVSQKLLRLHQADHEELEDLYEKSCHTLHALIYEKDVEAIKSLLRKKPFTSRWYLLAKPIVNRRTPVELALHTRNLDVLIAVLTPGTRVLDVSDDYCACLVAREWHYNGLIHEALRMSWFDAIDLLLNAQARIKAEYDVDVHAVGWLYETPLFIAVRKYHDAKKENESNLMQRWLNIIQTLLDRGVKIVFDETVAEIVNCPFTYCQENNLAELLDLFNQKLVPLYQSIQSDNQMGISRCRMERGCKALEKMVAEGHLIQQNDGNFLYRGWGD